MEKKFTSLDPKKWLEQYGDLLLQYTLPRVNDRELAEDLVQETFLSALKGLDGYKGEASEKNWIFAILKNKIIDHYRKKAASREILELPNLNEVQEDWFDETGTWVPQRAPHDWHNADNPLERKELQKIINWCKSNLKLLQQQVFSLKYMEDLESEEICKVLNITTSNYWILIHRARLQMRDCVEKSFLKI